MSFTTAVEFVLKEEGGYSDDPKDPGGETKFGISKRAYPRVDIPRLEVDDAIAIYRRDYWDRLPAIPKYPITSFCLFDLAVNAGVSQAVKILQAAISVNVDGWWGPKSQHALSTIPDDTAAALLCSQRVLFYSKLDGFTRYGKGWTRRTFRAFREALK